MDRIISRAIELSAQGVMVSGLYDLRRLLRRTMMLNKFFVYGTLRPGESRWSALESHVVKQEPGILYGAELYTTGSWPFITIDRRRSDKEVVGEVLEIAEENVAQVTILLDRIEGYNPRDEKNLHNLFIRSKEQIYCPTGFPVEDGHIEAYVYIGGLSLTLDTDEYRRIESGDWKQRGK